MGFGSILEIFKADDWSSQLVGMVSEMLELASDMFGYAVAVIVYGEADEESQQEIYDRDKQINTLEREVRRRVVTRLSVGGHRSEIPTGLIFMNVVKDGERIGDYIKNLYEIAEMMPAEPDRKLYQEYLVGRSRTIEDLFARTVQAFADSDAEKAADVINRARKLATQCEEVIREITVSKLPTQDAVCLVLILRFYKRVAAHMANIATTVVMPIDMLDFYDER
jgi:phosphate transport system protein